MTHFEKSNLAQTLRSYKITGLQKVSAIGGDPESSFESSFASLAYVYIRDKAPALLDYMVGFQLVDRNDDNTKAVGIFGFKLDNQWVYAPVFFLNGDLKGHELLYLKDQDTFVPMKENWVNYLVSKQPTVLGKGTSESMRSLGARQPNLYELSNPPSMGKFSSKIMPKMAEWAENILPQFAQWCSKHPDRMSKFAGLSNRLNLSSVLASDLRLVKTAVSAIKQYPGLKQAFYRYYNTQTLTDALYSLRDEAIQRPVGILSKSAAATKPAKVEVIADSLISDNTTELNDQERERLLRDGVLIRDHRNGEEVSKAYNVQITQALSSPDTTDTYEVLTKDGEFDKCLIVHNPHGSKGRAGNVVVMRLSDKKYDNYNAANVFVRQSSSSQSEVENYADWYDSLSDSKTMSVGGKYIVVSQNRTGSLAFEVDEKIDDSYYRVCWSTGTYNEPPSYMAETARRSVFDSNDSGNYVVLNTREGTGFKSVGGKLFVPPTIKIIELESPKQCAECSKKQGDCTCSYFHSPRKPDTDKPLKPGNIADLQLHIFQKTAEIKLWHDANEVVINRIRMAKLAGLVHLVRDHGFTERAAKRMLKESERMNGKRYRVKYAASYPGQYEANQGPGAPPFPDYYASPGDEMSANVPTVGTQADFVGVPEMSAQQTDPSVYDNSPQATPDPGSVQTAQQASQTGQKEVFDASMISGLIKSVRDSSLVDRYMGDLMKALDRLGRIYFLFLWHNDEFMERYGKSDLPELEDALRNSFEGLGDLVLFLRAKSVSPLEGTGELGEPSVDNAAMN